MCNRDIADYQSAIFVEWPAATGHVLAFNALSMVARAHVTARDNLLAPSVSQNIFKHTSILRFKIKTFSLKHISLHIL